MKITIRLIISVAVIVLLGALFSSYQQARQEEKRLESELEKRASVMADTLRISVETLLFSENEASLQKVMNKFSSREKLVGVDIHDIRLHFIVASSGLPQRLAASPQFLDENIANVEQSAAEYGAILQLGQDTLYVYSVPLRVKNSLTHVLTLIYDTSYINDRVHRLWTSSFLRALGQVFFMTLAILAIFLFNVMVPIRKTTEWIKLVRKGERETKLNSSEQLLLGPLASEINQMAKSLDLARSAAEEEARLRLKSEALWTPERLKEMLRLRLDERPLFVVSNREPYMHMRNGRDISCIVPASGLVTALEPVLKACSGTWIAQGTGNADKETVDEFDRVRVPPAEPKYTLRRVWIDKNLESGFYSGFSNEGLWPLCHIAHTRPIFRTEDWLAYQTVNRKFADVVIEEAKGVDSPYILIQDYHFALLPQMIKERRPDAKIAIFWHIPWPNPESFGICPWQKDLLRGMLGADLIGFHTQFHCNNFIASVDRFLETRIDYEHFTITRERHTTLIKPFPISIDFNIDSQPKHNADPVKEDLLKPYNIQAQWLGVGVDRLDYTKGILERFRAIEVLMDQYPKFKGQFTFVELGAPSRTMIPKYKEFIDEIMKESERINTKFKTKHWQPILVLMKHHSHEEIMPFYRAANVCLVTSLHDGMNLVAKEFISARADEQGVLILSQFTGAARELRDALIINPYDVGQTAQAIVQALDMSPEEQTNRMRWMRNMVKEHNIYRWAGELVQQLTQIRWEHEEHAA